MPLQFEQLANFDMHTKIALGRLGRGDGELTNITFESTLQDGALKVNKLHWSGRSFNKDKENFADISFEIQPKDQNYDLRLRATARSVYLRFLNLSAAEVDDYDGHDFDILLTSRGNDLRTVMAGLNGYTWIRGTPRDVQNRLVGAIMGDFFSQLIRLVNPYSEKETTTHIVCDLFFFEAEDGVVQSAPTLLLRTDKLDVMSVGHVNLKTEKISFGVGTTPRTGVGISAGDFINPFTRIGGTLADPKLSVDPTGSLVEGGAAVATLGLSIVAKSMYKRWLRPDQSCARYTKNATKYLSKIYPNDMPKN
jgi:hypothetical protein